jgi:four helix bundle protein
LPDATGFLFDELNRVALSVATNLAEGNDRLIKPDRRNFFKIARGRLGLLRAIFGDFAEDLRELCRF